MVDPARALANLGALEALGAVGEYGFRDALDYTRPLPGHRFAIVHSYMAHHIGMSLIALTNALTDNIWQWGGSTADILQTVLQGRTAQMPPWGEALRAAGGRYATDDVAFYVLSKSDPEVGRFNGDAAARGAKLFASICAACHGADARGNPQLGAPDLTDEYWLYGRSRAAIRAGLDQGRNGSMPAHEPLIGATRARLAAAWVWSLSHPQGTP
jgi:cytochrome c oxidase cbb3-type subunit 3